MCLGDHSTSQSGLRQNSDVQNVDDDWSEMLGAEVELKKLIDALIGDETLTKEKFTTFMSKKAKSHRREYDFNLDQK